MMRTRATEAGEGPGKHTLEVKQMADKDRVKANNKDQIIKDLENSVTGLLESYKMAMSHLEDANAGLAAGVVKGFFHGEIEKAQGRANRLKLLRQVGAL